MNRNVARSGQRSCPAGADENERKHGGADGNAQRQLQRGEHPQLDVRRHANAEEGGRHTAGDADAH